ncbi:hypothetical protein A1D22_06020 [Pasteurellaceae bacterium LFhippo2]|nr:hypothetical protein [Pasteurellaceae bacterium LFhippo2]
MLTEQDKQAILNGAYGITRNGYKCKLVYSSLINDEHKNLFIYYCGGHENSVWLTDDFIRHDHDVSDCDIIGLWQEPLEPFDLERALAGEPIMHIELFAKGYAMPDMFKSDKFYIQWESGFVDSYDKDNKFINLAMWKAPEPVTE